MRYRASWRHTSGFAYVIIFMGVLALAAGAASAELGMVALAALFPAYLFAIGWRLSAEIDEDGLRYQGWLASHDVKWRDVISVTHASHLSYPRNRYHGGSSYEVMTADDGFIINLLYFPAEFRRAFDAETKRHRLIRRKRHKDL